MQKTILFNHLYFCVYYYVSDGMIIIEEICEKDTGLYMTDFICACGLLDHVKDKLQE